MKKTKNGKHTSAVVKTLLKIQTVIQQHMIDTYEGRDNSDEAIKEAILLYLGITRYFLQNLNADREGCEAFLDHIKELYLSTADKTDEINLH